MKIQHHWATLVKLTMFHPPLTMAAYFTVSHGKIYSFEKERWGGIYV